MPKTIMEAQGETTAAERVCAGIRAFADIMQAGGDIEKARKVSEEAKTTWELQQKLSLRLDVAKPHTAVITKAGNPIQASPLSYTATEVMTTVTNMEEAPEEAGIVFYSRTEGTTLRVIGFDFEISPIEE